LRLNEVSLSGKTLHRCDACELEGELNSYIVEEDGRDLCLPCWYEGIKAKGDRPSLTPAPSGS